MRLATEERQQLEQFIARGQASSRGLIYTRILLKTDERKAGPAWTSTAIAEALDVSSLAVTRVRKRLGEEGFDRAFHHVTVQADPWGSRLGAFAPWRAATHVATRYYQLLHPWSRSVLTVVSIRSTHCLPVALW